MWMGSGGRSELVSMVEEGEWCEIRACEHGGGGRRRTATASATRRRPTSGAWPVRAGLRPAPLPGEQSVAGQLCRMRSSDRALPRPAAALLPANALQARRGRLSHVQRPRKV